MTQQKKSAWLGAAEADYYETQNDQSLLAADDAVNEAPTPPEPPKDYATLRAQFALRGRVLTRSHRWPDGRITYIVTTWSGARCFSHLHDVQGHLRQIEDGARIFIRGRGNGV